MSDQHEATVEAALAQSPRLRQLLQAVQQSSSGLTDKEFEAVLPTHEWRTATGARFTAPDTEVRIQRKRLAELGLIQKAGTGQHGAVRWKATPPEKVEAVSQRYASARRRTRKSRRVRSPQATLSEMHRTITGDWSQWQRQRKMILQLGAALLAVEPMAAWRSAPANEREWVRDEIADLVEWGQAALAAFEQRAEDDNIRSKIEKLENVSGRNAAEREAAARRVEVLKAKL
jgi:hypothetical protein